MESILNRPHAERDDEVRLADAGWTLDQQALFLANPGTGPQGFDPAALYAGLEAEIEVSQRLPGRESRKLERSLDASRSGRVPW